LVKKLDWGLGWYKKDSINIITISNFKIIQYLIENDKKLHLIMVLFQRKYQVTNYSKTKLLFMRKKVA
jgi:hypothetical protein